MKLAEKPKAAAVSIASNTALIILKLIAGILTGSVSLLAEAIHSVMDLIAAIVAFISVRIADKPADAEHHFGHGKAENISGVIEGLLIFVAACIIINEAVHRFIEGATMEMVELGIGIMAVSIVVNVIVSRYLLRVSSATDSLALEADARHLTTDVMTMSGVLIGLVAVRLTGLFVLDPIVAVLVALLIIKAAYDITKKSFGGLIDASLPAAEESTIKSCIMKYNTLVVDYHKLRTRKSGSQRYIDLHVIIPKNISIEEAHEVCDQMEKDIKATLQRTDVTIHVEPCTEDCDRCPVSCAFQN